MRATDRISGIPGRVQVRDLGDASIGMTGNAGDVDISTAPGREGAHLHCPGVGT